MKTIFVDTNLFIQCKPIAELPFKEIFQDEDIRLIVPRGVIKEIDTFKSQGNTRRASRAKLAFRLINKIPFEGYYKICEFLSIGLSSIKQLSTFPVLQGLNTDKVDDSIIQDMIAYSRLNTINDICLLCYDGGLITTAKEYGCNFEVIPDTWLLDPEPSRQDKQIRVLEEKIKALESKTPKININCYEGKSSTKKLTLDLKSYRELTSEELNSLVKLVSDKSPMHPNKETDSFPNNIHPPVDQKALQKYENKDYPEWLEGVTKQIKHLPNYLNYRNNLRALELEVGNIGSIPAENTLVRIEVSDAFNLHIPNEGTWVWKLNKAPDYRKIYLQAMELSNRTPNIFQTTRAVEKSLQYERTDKPKFYWKDKMHKNAVRLWEMGCDEFRHKHDDQIIRLNIMPIGNKHKSGSLKCSVFAKNISEPVELNIPIIVNNSEAQDSYLACKKFIESPDSPSKSSKLGIELLKLQKSN